MPPMKTSPSEGTPCPGPSTRLRNTDRYPNLITILGMRPGVGQRRFDRWPQLVQEASPFATTQWRKGPRTHYRGWPATGCRNRQNRGHSPRHDSLSLSLSHGEIVGGPCITDIGGYSVDLPDLPAEAFKLRPILQHGTSFELIDFLTYYK